MEFGDPSTLKDHLRMCVVLGGGRNSACKYSDLFPPLGPRGKKLIYDALNFSVIILYSELKRQKSIYFLHCRSLFLCSVKTFTWNQYKEESGGWVRLSIPGDKARKALAGGALGIGTERGGSKPRCDVVWERCGLHYP